MDTRLVTFSVLTRHMLFQARRSVAVHSTVNVLKPVWQPQPPRGSKRTWRVGGRSAERLLLECSFFLPLKVCLTSLMQCSIVSLPRLSATTQPLHAMQSFRAMFQQCHCHGFGSWFCLRWYDMRVCVLDRTRMAVLAFKVSSMPCAWSVQCFESASPLLIDGVFALTYMSLCF